VSFADWGEQPVKHLARPLRVFALTADAIAACPASASNAPALGPDRFQQQLASVSAAALLVVLGLGWWSARMASGATAATKQAAPELLVDLPFLPPSSPPLLRWSDLPQAHASARRALHEEVGRCVERFLAAKPGETGEMADVLAAMSLIKERWGAATAGNVASEAGDQYTLAPPTAKADVN